MLKKYSKLIVMALLFIVVITPFGGVFAAGESNGSLSVLDGIIKFFSWFWVIPAIVAWKLMTNDFVYWSIFHLDIYLWKLWNITKNFANYVIWFVFLATILKSFISPSKWPDTIKKLLPSLLISSVLVQASWFIMWALIDISTVMTAAVGSMPSTFISQSDIKAKLEQTKIPNCEIMMDIKDMNKASSKCSVENSTMEWKNILPKYDNVSWPLIYMWYSILGIYDFMKIDADKASFQSISTAMLIKVLIVFMFVLPIFLLMIVNIIRIVWIWIWIAFSPFLVLDSVLFQAAFNSQPLANKIKWFKIWNVLWLIFQPIAVVATIWLALIILIWMNNVLSGSSWADAKTTIKNEFGIECNSTDTCNISTVGGSFSIQWKIVDKTSVVKEDFAWSIWYIIMAFFTIFMLWWVLKAWFQMSEITKTFTDSVFKYTSNFAKTMPVLWWMSIKNIQETPSQLAQFSERISSKQSGKVQSAIAWAFGTKDRTITSDEIQTLFTWANNINNWSQTQTIFTKMKSLMRNKEWLTYNSPEFRKIVKWWLDRGWFDYIKSDRWLWLPNDITKENIYWNDKFKTFIYFALEQPASINNWDQLDASMWWLRLPGDFNISSHQFWKQPQRNP